MTISVPLSRGRVALISDEDAHVLRHKWSLLVSNNGKLYACRNVRLALADGRVKQRKILLHREIMNEPTEWDVDHEDGDGLNCQRHNLRVATRSQNMANSGSRKGANCPYKGVSIRRRRGGISWRAEITINGRKRDLGTYRNAEDAALAYNAAATATWGEFARVNVVSHEVPPVHTHSR